MPALLSAAAMLEQVDALHDACSRLPTGRKGILAPDLLALAGLCEAAATVASLQGKPALVQIAESRAEAYRRMARDKGVAGLVPKWGAYYQAHATARPE